MRAKDINRVEAGTLEKVKERVDALWRSEVVVQGHRGYDIYQAGQSFDRHPTE